MADYRVYLLTAQNKIAEASDIACASDSEALNPAAAMIGIHAAAGV